MHSLHPLDYLVLVFFLGGMLGMGAYFSRQQESVEDYFVGGRRMPWLAVGLSTLATLTSTITYLAVPGETIKNGIGYFSSLLAVPFILLFIWYVAAPFLMRLRLTSAYEYLEMRFDRRTRRLGSAMFTCLALGWMATVVHSAALGVAEMAGMPLHAVIAAVGIIGVAYTVMGGIRADIWTDVVQAVLMFAGALFAIGYVAATTGTGPAEWWRDAAQVRHVSVPLISLDPTVRISVFTVALNAFFWHACQVSGSQMAMQRFFTMPSVRAARASALVNAGANLAMLLLLALCGIALFSFYFRQPHLLDVALDPNTGSGADRVFPHFIARQLPPAVAGMLISALFAAAMSTLDSGVNSLSAVLSHEFRRGADPAPKGGLRAARTLTVGLGLAITLLAAGVDLLRAGGGNIIDIVPAAFNWVLGPLGGLFFAGMFMPRCTARSAIPAALAGGVVGLVTGLLRPLGIWPFSFAWVIVYSCLTTLCLAALLSLREKSPAAEPLTWRRVVREPEP